MLRRLATWTLCASVLAGLIVADPIDAQSASGPTQRHRATRAITHHHAGRHHKRSGVPTRTTKRASGEPQRKSAAVAPSASSPGTPRHLIWADEFEGPAGTSPSPENWSFDTGGKGWGNNELESYTDRPQNASL